LFDENWQPLGDPVARNAGFMDVPVLTGTVGDRAIQIRCEGPLVTRKRIRHGFITDEDQQRRFAGDRGFEFAPTSAQRQVRGPVVVSA
jgi:hypothetical protein